MFVVKSKDGTPIAYSRAGSGPVIILVGGGLDDGSENAPLAEELAKHYTVFNYARRGRGKSGNTLPYTLRREIEDIEVLVAEAGGSAHLFGASSGGALALEAAAAGVAISKIAVYEVPYSIGDEAVSAWMEYVEKLKAALATNKRNEALELFMRLAGASEENINDAKNSPYWAPLITVAPTLAHDAAILGSGQPPEERFRNITQPVLVMTGGGLDPGMSGLHPNFFGYAADAIARPIPHSERQTIENEGHIANPHVLGQMLRSFFQ